MNQWHEFTILGNVWGAVALCWIIGIFYFGPMCNGFHYIISYLPTMKKSIVFSFIQLLLEEKVIWSKALTEVICLFKVLRWTFYLYRGSSLVDPGAFQRECQYYISLSAAQQEKSWTQHQVSQYNVQHKGFIFLVLPGYLQHFG